MPSAGSSSATQLKVLPREGQAFHFSYEKGQRGPVAAKPLGEQGPDPVSPQRRPSSRYVSPAEELARLRGKDGASGGFAFGLPTLAVCLPEPRKAFRHPCSFWETGRGQAGLLRQATLLSVGSALR